MVLGSSTGAADVMTAVNVMTAINRMTAVNVMTYKHNDGCKCYDSRFGIYLFDCIFGSGSWN
jgi:hypothetical protein